MGADKEPTANPLTTEATEEHGGKPRSELTVEYAEKAEARREEFGVEPMKNLREKGTNFEAARSY